MSSIRKVTCFILLQLILARPQINLDLTDEIGNGVSEHDCIHIAAKIEYDEEPIQIISYCMSEWPSKWQIQENNLDKRFTFAELANLNISSQQLYLWSSPMDTIERYQFYLNHLSTSKDLSLTPTEMFYNCTSPRFGPLCQYSLDGYESYPLSLRNVIHNFYSHPYEPTNMTCYMHLQCKRGSSSACLDWAEICDGTLDCMNNGIDEEHCWQLQINECEKNEYRCENGQCIPKIFYKDDNATAFDCVDQTDEGHYAVPRPIKAIIEPTFAQEDIRCGRTELGNRIFTSSCVSQRKQLIMESMFLDKPDSISDNCWFAFRCYFAIPNDSHPKCETICLDRISCQQIINDTCPEILYIPHFPIAFGHMYLAYTKQAAIHSLGRILPPTYICFNDQLCSGFFSNTTLLSFNNTTCREPQSFPLIFSVLGRGDWLRTYVSPIYRQLHRCNTIKDTVCNSPIMYQCLNSSKCITNFRVGDHMTDCDYGDDEHQSVINDVCLRDGFRTLFYCTSTHKCIAQKLIGDRSCDCGYDQYGLCEDEDPILHYIRKHISFTTICDGFAELLPVIIDGINQTDETECDLWPCNNTYTRCDGFWNCFNGADEVDCDSTPLLNCSQQHICVSPDTYEFMCLPLGKANDGNIDCIGANDEPKFCRSNNYIHNENNFFCHNHINSFCIPAKHLCFDDKKCLEDYYTHPCDSSGNLTKFFNDYINTCLYMNYDVNKKNKEFFCQLPKDNGRPYPINFTLDIRENANKYKPIQDTNRIIQHSSFIQTPVQPDQRCHRGFPLRVWINTEKNLTSTTCLCPPSFYGNICQYQNQRVSLTVKFQTYSDSLRILFTIVISLIDDSNERIIHSHQQFTYLYIRDCKFKFNIYLLYSTRPKNPLKNYSVHIDIYEKISFNYRGSLLIPLNFSFLPIHRIATQLTIPRTNEKLEGRSNKKCEHGRCMEYAHDSNGTTFCYCTRGWSGRYCTIPHTCKCSDDSLCVGVTANNRPICICPTNKFGSRCLLSNIVCQSNANLTCYNGGKCIPIDQHMAFDKKFFCMCPKGFTGDRCEILDKKLIMSFNKDIVLPHSMAVHFIRVMDNAAPLNGSIVASVSMNKKIAIAYWTYPFHIAFAKLFNDTFYLIVVQKTYNESTTIIRTINPSDRCHHIREALNETIAKLHLLRRIKYYHLACQKHSPLLSCFYDDDYFCLCNNFGHQRLANCFEFNQTIKFDCFGQSNYQNGADCVQDKANCPQTSMCVCPTCYYGALCQFTSVGLGLSLDGILG